MPLLREDKRFVVGLGVALAVVAVYWVAVHGLLRSTLAAREAELQRLRAQAQRFSRGDAETLDAAERKLDRYQRALAERLDELERAIEFDPGPLLDPLAADADRADPPALYLKLSRTLHDRLRAAVGQHTQPVRVPEIFDPQGKLQEPPRASVPRLHRQLVAAYEILRAAVEHRVAILGLRATPPGREADASPYLDRVQLTVRAHSSLGALAALIHALGRPPRPQQRARFLSVDRLEIAADPSAPGQLRAEITFVAVRIDPKAPLAPE